MLLEEFSELFDVHYNNITSNQAPGLNEYEKSVFLTKAQDEIVKNYYTANSKGNTTQQGFDDSAKRQADFSILMKTVACAPSNTKEFECTNDVETAVLYGNAICFTDNQEDFVPENGTYQVINSTVTLDPAQQGHSTASVTGLPEEFSNCTMVVSNTPSVFLDNRLDKRSKIYTFPSDVFIMVNETLVDSDNEKEFQVIPLRHDEYTRLMSKPFKRPLKHQAWRLINSGRASSEGTYTKIVEIIAASQYDNSEALTYTVRYVRRPLPIIVGDIDGLKINGKTYADVASIGCELDPIVHEDILQRAVELAKIAWTQTGQDNTNLFVQAGQRSE